MQSKCLRVCVGSKGGRRERKHGSESGFHNETKGPRSDLKCDFHTSGASLYSSVLSNGRERR